jgi:hypothetical protein
MATLEIITIPFDLPRAEAAALAQFIKRTGYTDCVRLASRFDRYADRAESDVMWSALCMLQNQLAEAGFAPR